VGRDQGRAADARVEQALGPAVGLRIVAWAVIAFCLWLVFVGALRWLRVPAAPVVAAFLSGSWPACSSGGPVPWPGPERGGEADMARYLLIESKDPLGGGTYAFELGRQLAEQQHQVTIYLLQDGVFTARSSFPAGERLRQEAERHGLTLLADELSLRQRGIVGGRLAAGVRRSQMDELVDLLMERSDKAIWH
jgi:sulfur relay (sulfurtransferase) complex TusBCD TusD component (DsrE family)